MDGFFPRATGSDAKAGWTIDFALLKRATDSVEEMDEDFPVTMEQTELVLLAVEQMGYRVVPPNAIGQGSAACGASPAPTGCASSGTNNERTDK